ncbi:MAG: DUF1273 domain-containing protein [Ruminococcus flavefaciens]|nr:DUF1273 domain-containing protein [Ruminococcus flavefaciens]
MFCGVVLARERHLFMLNLIKFQTVCFIGHRSQKLPWRFNKEDERCRVIKILIHSEIENAIQSGYNTFLCGMALGFDMICAETVFDLKKQYPNIKLIGALPCRTQDRKWQERDRERYKQLLNRLDDIRCIHNEYIGVECMLERNRYMVDNSSLMIALYNGLSGGTKSTIDYARKQGLKIVIIKP